MSLNDVRKLRRLPVLLVAVALALCLPFGPARAQGPSTPPVPDEASDAATPVVRAIRVEGNLNTDSTRIVRTFDLPTGKPYNSDRAKRGYRKLLALGLFTDVRPEQRANPDGSIDIVLVVRERPRIGTLSFSGNRKKDNADLEKKLFLRGGESYSSTLVRTQVDSLLQYYRDEGFPRTKVNVQADTVKARNVLNLTFQVEEGEKLRITQIEFRGATAFTGKRLRKELKTHAKGFFGGGELKDETFAEDREKLEGWYHDHGYRDMAIDSFTTRPGAAPRALTLVVWVNEGRPYVFGDVTWNGNHVLKTEALQKLWGKRGTGGYDHSRMERTTAQAYGEYAEQGYLYVRIDPAEVPRDSVVDVNFTVTEGSPSHVRLVSVVGNKGTRENVIRRELDVHEGDLFRKSALLRSQDDLRRLGLFEEVTPDFSQAESTDVDLVFKVKEKQVGTASAGAGYTSQTGLTGFLEVGHNNVLGNGQQLQLHLERGSQVENYSLSFTEPWFHDSPTLLGYSAYSMRTLLTEFDESRRGASVRIGRPLPWPDYSRGSLGYTLENVKIDNVRDSLTLAGVPIGQWQLTSTLEENFVRNSADNAFYPTKGTRLTATDAFTGGPFFGDVNYHLHRYEGRAWLPSITKHATTMVRLRIGLLGQYTWQKSTIPDYARFRLGGGTTIDPVRGYMDYQIVPPKFISDVVTSHYVSKIDSLTTPGKYDTTWTTTTTRRRYPGGRYMGIFTLEQQFPIVNPLHGVFFFDAGNTWDQRAEIKPFQLKYGAGVGVRMEIPILGNVGLDYGYGFNRDDGARWQAHFLLGNVGF